jgi:dTDP-glucose 4,6-dehydratase
MNIGNPHEISMLGLAELIRDLAGSASPIVFVPRPEDDPSVRQPDIAVARSALAWEPTVGLQDGLELTIRWFRTARRQVATGTPMSEAAPILATAVAGAGDGPGSQPLGPA